MTVKKMTRSQLKKTAIINAAKQEFQDKGFQQASMDNIARNADVSKRTVYNHFASKELLFEVIACEMIKLICLFDEIKYDKNKPIKGQLQRLAEEEVKLLVSKKVMAGSRVFIREALNNPDLVASAMQQIEQYNHPIFTWFVDACEAGALKSDHPEFVSEQFVAVIKGFCFWPQVVQCSPFPDAQKQQMVIDTVVDMIIKQYVA